MSKQQAPIRSVAVQRAGAARASAVERENKANAMIDALIARVTPQQQQHQQHIGTSTDTTTTRNRNTINSSSSYNSREAEDNDADDDDDGNDRQDEEEFLEFTNNRQPYTSSADANQHCDDNPIIGQFAEFDRNNERLQQDIHIRGKKIDDVEHANEAALAQLAELGHHLPSYQDVVNGVHSILSRLTRADIERQRQSTSEINTELLSNMEGDSSSLRRLKREIRNSELSTLAAIDEAAVLGSLQDDLLQRYADEREAIKTDAREATAKLAIDMSGTAALMSKIDVLYKQQMTLSSELLKRDALEKSIKELLGRTHSLVVTKENLLLRLMNIANVKKLVGGDVEVGASGGGGASNGPPSAMSGANIDNDDDESKIAEEIQELEHRYSKTVKDWQLEHITVDEVVYKLKPRFATVQRMLREATAARDVEQERLNRITEHNEFLQSEVNSLLDEVCVEDPDGVDADPAHYPSLQTVNDLDVVVKLTQTMKKASSELAGLGRFIAPIVAIADLPIPAMAPTVPDTLIKIVQEQRRIRANKIGEIKSALMKERGGGGGSGHRPNSAKHHQSSDPSSLLLSDLHDIELAVRIYISQQQQHHPGASNQQHQHKNNKPVTGGGAEELHHDVPSSTVEGSYDNHVVHGSGLGDHIIVNDDDAYARILKSGVLPSHPLARQAELDVIPPLITHDSLEPTMIPLYIALGAETSGGNINVGGDGDDESTTDGGVGGTTTTSLSRDGSRPPSPRNHHQHHRPRPPSSLGSKSRGQTPPVGVVRSGGGIGSRPTSSQYNHNRPASTQSNRPHSSQSRNIAHQSYHHSSAIDLNNILFTRVPTLSASDILSGKHLFLYSSATMKGGSGTSSSGWLGGPPPDHPTTNKYWLPLVPVMNERWSLSHTEKAILCVLNDVVSHAQEENNTGSTNHHELDSKRRGGGAALSMAGREGIVPSWLTFTRLRKDVSATTSRNRHNTVSGFDNALKATFPSNHNSYMDTGTSSKLSPETQKKLELEQCTAEFNAFWRQGVDGGDYDGGEAVEDSHPDPPRFIAGKGPAFDVANLLPTLSAALRESCIRLTSTGQLSSAPPPAPVSPVSTSGSTIVPAAAADLPPTSRPRSGGGGGPDTHPSITSKHSLAAYQLAANLFTSAIIYRGCSGICEAFLAVLDGELPASSVCTAVQNVNTLFSGTTAVTVGGVAGTTTTGVAKYGINSRINSVAAPSTAPPRRPSSKRSPSKITSTATGGVGSATAGIAMTRSAKTLLSALHKKYLLKLCLSTFHLNQICFSLVLECGFTSSDDTHINVKHLCGPLPSALDWSSSSSSGGATIPNSSSSASTSSSVSGVWCSGAHGNVTASLVNGRPDLLIRTSIQHALIHHKQLTRGIEDLLLSPNVHSGVQCPDFLLPAHAVQVLGCARWLPEEAPVWSANNENLEEVMAGARLTKWLPKVHPQSVYTPAGVNEFAAAAASGGGGRSTTSPTRARATMAAGSPLPTTSDQLHQTDAQRKFARRYQQQHNNDCGEAIFSHMGVEHVVRLANPLSVVLVAMNLLLSLEAQQRAERAVKKAAKIRQLQELRRRASNHLAETSHRNHTKSGRDQKNGDAFSDDENEDVSRHQSSNMGASTTTTSVFEKSNINNYKEDASPHNRSDDDEEHEEESLLDESSNESYLDSSSLDNGNHIEVEADSFSSDGEYSSSSSNDTGGGDSDEDDATSTSTATSQGVEVGNKKTTQKSRTIVPRDQGKGGRRGVVEISTVGGKNNKRSKKGDDLLPTQRDNDSVAPRKTGGSSSKNTTSRREDTTMLSGKPPSPREKSASKFANKSRRSFNRNKSFFSSGASVGVGNEDGWEELPVVPIEVLRDIQRDCIHLRNTRELKAAARAYQRNSKLIPTWLLVEAAKITSMNIIRPIDSPHAATSK